MSSLLDDDSQKIFLKKIFDWYPKGGRHDMPWRKNINAYAVFVSEFMLQQTTVATVVPYFERFMKRFPTLKSLANADLSQVLALWSGLGYYARARHLWSAIKTIYEERGGKVPVDTDSLVELPGVGAYTAGAVSTIAYNRPAVVLDGNIIRVLMRVLALADDPKMKATQIILSKVSLDLSTIEWKSFSKRLLKKSMRGPRHLTLALMDLGAQICLPKNPRCLVCPVSQMCLALKHGQEKLIPVSETKMERPIIRQLSAIVEKDGKWLMAQRPNSGLFGGLWEFPSIEAPKGVEPVPLLEGSINKETGFKIQVKQALPAFEHQLTHRRLVVRPFVCEVKGGVTLPTLPTGVYENWKWISPQQLSRHGVSSVTKRIVADLVHPPSHQFPIDPAT